jgi:hypothetical protein
MMISLISKLLRRFGLRLFRVYATAETWSHCGRHAHLVGKPKWHLERR